MSYTATAGERDFTKTSHYVAPVHDGLWAVIFEGQHGRFHLRWLLMIGRFSQPAFALQFHRIFSPQALAFPCTAVSPSALTSRTSHTALV